ncbi:DUF1778 domain-containing protein [Granulicella sibirica]|uniref:Prevent host death protein, Phd antitoxin n=1 Tax=Granulicella sibirica TaxID=2479048 RepID=A0A4Q0TAC2_9BACT|nr:DUF1778 domain-containing protein [Granulicella sibirica]RXH58716.1 hypothetical protein GRAN_2026 [Granulicella sibirica]
MEIHLTPEIEARITRIAEFRGTTAEQFVLDAVLTAAEEDQRVLEGVQRGLTQSARGEFIEQDEMDRRFQKMMHS